MFFLQKKQQLFVVKCIMDRKSIKNGIVAILEIFSVGLGDALPMTSGSPLRAF